MKKTRLFLLFGILVSLLPASLISKARPQYSVSAEGEALDYVEEIDYEYMHVIRTCKDYYPAEIYEQFAAPNGSTFKLNAPGDLFEILEEDVKNITELQGSATIPMVDVVIRRGLNGAYIYSESGCDWDIDLSSLSDFISGRLESYTLYEIQDKKLEFEVDGNVSVEIYTPGSPSFTYVYNFEIKPYKAKPYVDGDILSLAMSTYAHSDENRVNVHAYFNTPIFETSTGFITDGREEDPYYPGSYNENYTIDIIDEGTNTILESSKDYASIEISPIPEKPMTVFARLSFKEDGIPYTFYSNRIVCEDNIGKALLDGYNNRDSFGIDEKGHVLTIPTTIPLDEIYGGSHIMLYYLKDGERVIFAEHNLVPEITEEEIGILNDPDFWFVKFFEKKCTPDFFDFELPFDKVGDYDIYAQIGLYSDKISYNREDGFIKTIHVVTDPVIYTDDVQKIITSDITIDGQEIKNAVVNEKNEICIRCVSGGSPIVIESTIASDLLNDGEAPTFTFNDNSGGAIQVKTENEGRRLVITPFTAGSCKLEIATDVRGFGVVTKVFNFSVDADLTDKITLNIADEFHYSGKNLLVEAFPKDGQKYSNLSLTWKVLNKEEKEAEFVAVSPTSIELVAPSQNDYTIYAYYNGFEVCSITANVRDFNLDAFIKHNIVWIMLISFSLLALAIVVNVFLKKKDTIIEQMNNAYAKLKEINLDAPNSDIEVAKVKLLLQTCLSYSKDLNIDGLNQYEKTIRYISKALDGVKKLEKDVKLKKDEDRNKIYEQVEKDLAKAIMVVTDIQTARSIAEANSLIANTNNYAKLEKEKKEKKSKRKE